MHHETVRLTRWKVAHESAVIRELHAHAVGTGNKVRRVWRVAHGPCLRVRDRDITCRVDGRSLKVCENQLRRHPGKVARRRFPTAEKVDVDNGRPALYEFI